MTREIALSHVAPNLSYFNACKPTFAIKEYKKWVNKIYDDFESKTCSNCKLLNGGIGCEIYPAAWNWLDISETEFGCNQWELKDK